jgi:hypothetical protein
MRALAPSQFYPIAGTNPNSFGARVNRGEVALAFGTDRPLVGGKLLDLDAVASILVDELTPAFGRKFAPVIIRAHPDEWLAAVGRADTTAEPVYVVVFEHGEPHAGKRAYRDEYRVANGIFAEFANLSFAGLPSDKVPVRTTMINVSDILHRIRHNAARIGVDLSAPFFPPPGEPLFERVIRTAKKDRDKALALFHEHRIGEASR